jgi:hypothetical protein
LKKAYGLGLAVALAATLTPARTVGASGEDSVSLGRLVRLSTVDEIEELLVATAPSGPSEAAESATAVAWSVAGDLKGRLINAENPNGVGLSLGQGEPAALMLADDGTLRVGYREAHPGDDLVKVTRFDADGSVLGSTTMHSIGSSRGLGMDFFSEGGVATAVSGGAQLEVTLLSPEGATIAEASLSPVATAGEDRSPRVSIHGDEVLVGWDRFAACGGSKEKHVSVVTRLDGDAQLVRHPRRFSSGACGQSGKRLSLLDGPSQVGSLAVFQDRSARRFITGLPPQSELEFNLAIAPGELVAALSMDDSAGRLLVVTRTTTGSKPVRLFAQGFGRDGQPRTPKVAVDEGARSAAGLTPTVAASLDAAGNARIAFTRSGTDGDGLFLRELAVRIP